jgi:NADPH-dependent ferric siderophore reductase
LTDFAPDLPAQWVKIFFPGEKQEKTPSRVYTIRRYSEARRELAVDVVLHGAGPGSGWAAKATVGDVVHLAGPRAGYRHPPEAGWIAMFGDSTSLPAISAITEALPPTVEIHTFVSVAEDERYFEGESHKIGWVTGSRSSLMQAAMSFPIPQGRGHIWIAAEASLVQDLRGFFSQERNLHASWLTASGYWKLGVADHRN